MRGERIQIPQKRVVIGPPRKLHLMALVALESISVNFRGIAMGLYRGWRVSVCVCVWGGLCVPVFPGFPGSACAWVLCLCVCLSISLSVYQSICVSKSLYMPVCLHVSLSSSLSLSICGVDLADQGSRARYRALVIQVFSWDSKSVPFPINLSW